MKYIVRYVLLFACMLCCNLSFGQTYNVQVGETLQLNVPSVPVGYVDKAIWACAKTEKQQTKNIHKKIKIFFKIYSIIVDINIGTKYKTTCKNLIEIFIN